MSLGALAGPRYGTAPARRDARWGISLIGLLVVLLGAVVVHKLYAEKAEAPATVESEPSPPEAISAPAGTESLFGEFQLELPADGRRNAQTGTVRPKTVHPANSQDPFPATGQPQTIQIRPRSSGEHPSTSNRPTPSATATKLPVWASSADQPQGTNAIPFQRSVTADKTPPALIPVRPAVPSSPNAIAPTGPAPELAEGSDPFATPTDSVSAPQQSRQTAKPIQTAGSSRAVAPSFQEPVRQTQHTEAVPSFDLTEPPAAPAPAPTPAPAQHEHLFVPVQIGEEASAGAAAMPTPVAPESPDGETSAEPAPWTFEASEPVPLPEVPHAGSKETPEHNPFIQQQTAPAALSTPTPTPAAPQLAATDQIHDVVAGDNYWTISREHYGSGRYFGALAEYNRQRIPRPEKMKPGMKVLIPDAALLEQRYPKLTGQDLVEKLPPGVPEQGFFVDANGQPMYRIGKGDTLTEIAHAHLGRMTRWTEIMVMNREHLKNPNALKLGMILRLPRDASRVTLAPEGAVIR